MTFAPRSASSIVQYGPASTREKSATSSPESGPGRSGSLILCLAHTVPFSQSTQPRVRITDKCPSAEYGELCRSLSRRAARGRRPGISHRNLRGALAHSPVGADGARRLQEQREVLAGQYLKGGLGGVRVDVHGGDHPAVAVSQRHRDRPDTGGELFVGERPAA